MGRAHDADLPPDDQEPAEPGPSLSPASRHRQRRADPHSGKNGSILAAGRGGESRRPDADAALGLAKDQRDAPYVSDSGGFDEFFPREDDARGNEALLQEVPNLDTFDSQNGFWGRQIKTSLGNTLRLLNPIIILDEGHKAYSETAQDTLCGFNPSILVEFSATPPEGSNILVDVTGIELNREEMIKFDLHVFNKASPDWKDTLLDSHRKLEELAIKARDHHSQAGARIRPICLIQVERTGKDQRGLGKVHSEDVREHLTKIIGIPAEEVAVKTSEKDELKDVDDIGGLMSPDCRIRYIITKQALQEGWDCAFAYVLAILTNPGSKTALTQLVGRILRQPYARKTGVKELDESYVYCFQHRGAELLEEIRKGFRGEGLGDLVGRVAVEDEATGAGEPERVCEVREHLRPAAGQVILPVFVMATEPAGERSPMRWISPVESTGALRTWVRCAI